MMFRLKMMGTFVSFLMVFTFNLQAADQCNSQPLSLDDQFFKQNFCRVFCNQNSATTGESADEPAVVEETLGKACEVNLIDGVYDQYDACNEGQVCVTSENGTVGAKCKQIAGWFEWAWNPSHAAAGNYDCRNIINYVDKSALNFKVAAYQLEDGTYQARHFEGSHKAESSPPNDPMANQTLANHYWCKMALVAE